MSNRAIPQSGPQGRDHLHIVASEEHASSFAKVANQNHAVEDDLLTCMKHPLVQHRMEQKLNEQKRYVRNARFAIFLFHFVLFAYSLTFAAGGLVELEKCGKVVNSLLTWPELLLPLLVPIWLFYVNSRTRVDNRKLDSWHHSLLEHRYNFFLSHHLRNHRFLQRRAEGQHEMDRVNDQETDYSNELHEHVHELTDKIRYERMWFGIGVLVWAFLASTFLYVLHDTLSTENTLIFAIRFALVAYLALEFGLCRLEMDIRLKKEFSARKSQMPVSEEEQRISTSEHCRYQQGEYDALIEEVLRAKHQSPTVNSQRAES